MRFQYTAVYPHLFKQSNTVRFARIAQIISLIIEDSYDIEDFLAGCADYADKIPAAESHLREPRPAGINECMQFVIRWLIIR